jgi:hypothetical protein
MRLDLHIHTTYSRDSKISPRAVVGYARKAGLDGIAVVDHGTIKGGLAVKELAPEGFIVIVGSEIKTTRGEVMGFFLEEEIGGEGFRDVVEEIRAQGGLAVVSHPYDPFRPYSFSPLDEDAYTLDGVEVCNSRCILSRTNKKALDYAKKHRLLMTAGSDAHTPGEIGTAGVVVEDIEDIRQSGKAEIFCRQTPLVELFKARLSRLL